MGKLNERAKEMLFIIINGLFAIVLMVYYVFNETSGFPYSLIPAYFFGVIAAAIVMFVVHPKVKAGRYNRKAFRLFNAVILLLTIIILVVLVILENQ